MFATSQIDIDDYGAERPERRKTMIHKDARFQDMYTSLDDLSDAERADLLVDPEKEEKEVAEMYAKWEEDVKKVNEKEIKQMSKKLERDENGNGTEILRVNFNMIGDKKHER